MSLAAGNELPAFGKLGQPIVTAIPISRKTLHVICHKATRHLASKHKA